MSAPTPPARRPNIAVCIPYYRSVEGPTLMACMDLAYQAGDFANLITIGTSGCYVEDNRNGCVQYALNSGIPFDWLLWVDGDMIFPGNALKRLVGHGKDIVGANYRQRTPPYKFTGVYADESDTHLMEPGLHRMIQLPTGLLLTRFDIYRKMRYPWFKPGMHHEPRDDIWFCREAAKLGYEIWCDHDLTKEVRHIATQEIAWFSPEQLVRVEGAQIDNEKAAIEAQKRAALSREAFRTRAAAE